MKTKSILAVAALVLIAGCGKKEPEVAEVKPAETMPAEQQQQSQATDAGMMKNEAIPTVAGDTVTTASGLKYIDMTAGTGDMPKAEQIVEFHYTGWLTDGTKFDSSRDKGEPLVYPLARLAKGVGEGLLSMKIGGGRLLIIPSNLGYGEQGMPGFIPPNATLIFDVELLSVK